MASCHRAETGGHERAFTFIVDPCGNTCGRAARLRHAQSKLVRRLQADSAQWWPAVTLGRQELSMLQQSRPCARSAGATQMHARIVLVLVQVLQ